MSAVSNPWLAKVPTDWSCPFRHGSVPVCLAALSPCDAPSGHTPARTEERCDSEDHETCALYLSKILRSLRPSRSPAVGELTTK